MLCVTPHLDRLGWRDAVLALALFAAIVRAFVPQGFMLGSGADGAPEIVLCTADGATSLGGGAPHGESDVLAGMHGPCAFAGLAAMAPPPDLIIVSVAQAIELRLVTPDESPRELAALSHRLQAPRAPPLLHA